MNMDKYIKFNLILHHLFNNTYYPFLTILNTTELKQTEGSIHKTSKMLSPALFTRFMLSELLPGLIYIFIYHRLVNLTTRKFFER